jgi:lambda repressor-like predicted transcriptional regulator
MSKRFCIRGHDTELVGRYVNGACKTCDKMGKQGRLTRVKRYECLPIAPLMAIMGARGITIKSLGNTLSREFHRWKKIGSLPVMAADRIACDTLGLHPSEIWGSAWFDITEEVA